MSEFMKPEILTVIDDKGVEVDVPQSEFWQYEHDAVPDAVWWDQLPPQEHPHLTYDYNETGEI